MITTSTQLKHTCELILKFKSGKAWPIDIASAMYKKLCQWQLSDKYPSILAFKQGATCYMARVR